MTRSPDTPPAFHEIRLDRISREGVVREIVGDAEILVVATRQGIRVYNGLCPHLGGPLLEGEVRGGVIRCPWHGYAFDLASARCLSAPGGPWRSLVGGCATSDDPLEIELLPLPFEERDDHIRVQLAGPAVEHDASTP